MPLKKTSAKKTSLKKTPRTKTPRKKTLRKKTPVDGAIEAVLRALDEVERDVGRLQDCARHDAAQAS